MVVPIHKSELSGSRFTLQPDNELPSEDCAVVAHEPNSLHPSPLVLFNSISKSETPSKINSAEDFEKFLILIIQECLDTNESQMNLQQNQIQISQERKKAIHQKLKEINIEINEDGSVAFWNTAQGYVTVATMAVGLGSFFFGLPGALVTGAAFLTAWTSAIKSFFEGRREKQECKMITIQEAHDLSTKDLNTKSKVISKSFDEWHRLAMTLANVIKSNHNVKNQIVQNIRR